MVFLRKTCFFVVLSLSALSAVIADSGVSSYDEDLLRAHRFSSAGLYSDAALIYNKVLGSLDVSVESSKKHAFYDMVRYLLAESYYLSDEYRDALDVIARADFSDEQYHAKALLLQGSAYHHRGDYAQAVSVLVSYLNLGPREALLNYDKAQWLLGFSYYKLGKMTFSRRHLRNIKYSEGGDNGYYHRAQIYLARIHLIDRNPDNAVEVLEALLEVLPSRDALSYEASYILGEIAFRSGRYSEAVEWYSSAVPHRNYELADWHSNALYNIGWCYLKLGEEGNDDITTRSVSLSNAIEVFEKLAAHNGDERAYLALARIYLLRKDLLGDESDSARIEEILSHDGLFLSRDTAAEALLLRGEAAKSYNARADIYRSLTDDSFSASPLYGLGWYYRGLNDFKEYLEGGSSWHNLCDDAIEAFGKAYDILVDSDKEKAALALKYLAQANFSRGTSATRLSAAEALERLVSSADLFDAIDCRDEVLYLQGFVAYHLEDAEASSSLVVDALERTVAEYPDSAFAPMALSLLGTHYFHSGAHEDAEKTFLVLAKRYPSSSLAGDAWFWAGEAAYWQHSDDDIVKKYRRTAFECYPSSSHASEAYFSYYSFAEYLRSNVDALEHIYAMEDLFPTTPHLIVAYYLIGLDNKVVHYDDNDEIVRASDYKAAISSFEKASDAFETCYDSGVITDDALEYFATIRYRAILENALIKMIIADDTEGAARRLYLESAAKILNDIVRVFDGDDDIMRSLTGERPFPRLREESEYSLAIAYIKMKDYSSAEKALSSLLGHYSSAKISRGYYLSRAWYEQGRLAMEAHNDYDLAIKFLLRAEEAAQDRVLSDEQNLDLWIQQSACYRALEQYDTAMLMLSKVINEDVISPLRIKAMYLRAEVYEIQGRRELALKQLEVTALSGGVWGTLAQEKLEQDYVFF